MITMVLLGIVSECRAKSKQFTTLSEGFASQNNVSSTFDYTNLRCSLMIAIVVIKGSQCFLQERASIYFTSPDFWGPSLQSYNARIEKNSGQGVSFHLILFFWGQIGGVKSNRNIVHSWKGLSSLDHSAGSLWAWDQQNKILLMLKKPSGYLRLF